MGIVIRDEGSVRVILLDRARAFNALDPEHFRSLDVAIAAAMGSPDVRAIVLGATGRIFSIGADVAVFEAARIEGRLEALFDPRGRFNPGDGQLYLCGLVIWQSNGAQKGAFHRVGDDFHEIQRLRLRLWRPSEQHQVANHVPNAEGLRPNGQQCLSTLRVGLAFEQQLGSADDGGDGIVDLVAGSGREFSEGFELRSQKSIRGRDVGSLRHDASPQKTKR